MKAQIITIGDEILIGQIINSNAAFIGNKLSDVGVEITKSTVVPDEYNAVMNEFKFATENNDLVLVTGGLGPTHDDITKKCIVDFFDTELVENKEVMEDLKTFFVSKGREIIELNKEQAMFPKIARPIRNSRGTAPGILIEKDRKIFVAMPGVPFEMKEMLLSTVVPKLRDMIVEKEKKFTVRKNLLTTGIPESVLYQKLGDINELLGDAKMAFLPSQFGVRIRLTAISESEEKANEMILEVEQKIRSKAGRYIFGKDDDTLEGAIAKILTDRDLKIATAESCTGGLIANRLTNLSGSSKYFERGVVTYSNAAKVELLKVDEDTIMEKGAVSREVAMQMAEGVKAVSGVDIGLSVTGIMGPTGGTDEKPVGLVYIGICDEKVCTAEEFHFGNDRLLNKDRTSQAALEMVRRHLLGIPYGE
ncbi:MAG: competence/damage-inducible protein A [Chlorobi bacterium]|nr:competence/damage-inducible protein A [Chlorobiota bacterium]